MSEGEDIELRMIRLRKIMKAYLSAQSGQEKTSSEHSKTIASEELRKYLYERGDEVLDAALELNKELTESVAESLLKLIKEGKIMSISGSELLRLFRQLGLNVKLDTSIRIKKGGEEKSIKERLGESWTT